MWLPARLTGGMNVILGPRDFLFTAVFNRRRTEAEAARLLGGALGAAGFDAGRLLGGLERRDYLLWAFITHRQVCPPDTTGTALQELVGGRCDRWHPDVRRLVAATDAATIASFPFRTSVRPEPWPATTVTLIGDAIHSMTPAGGVGANTALRDATTLCRALAAVDRGQASLQNAIQRYEAGMLDYGFAAVRRSMRNTEQALAGRFSREGTRSFFRLCGAIPALRRAVFSENWTEKTNAAAEAAADAAALPTGSLPR
jgi:2-polyprenyl-6-methoxyphenol hydroxylase-like FAD-dependent oxidoreductase